MTPPVEPPPSPWRLTLEGAEPGEDVVGVGADLGPGTLLAAYRAGMFPMGLGEGGRGPLGWWSPDPRGVLEVTDLRVTRSLRRSCRRLQVRVDTAFDEVVAGCADPSRSGRWITPAVARAYAELHRLGWAHSVEAWDGDQLVGGLYGIAVGGLFAGESMFHRSTDASKVALVGLVELLGADLPDVRAAGGDRLVDVQWSTPHLAGLGVREVSRADYLARLPRLLRSPLPDVWR